MNDYLSHRRARLAAALALGDAVLVAGAGEPVPLPEGSDQTYPFRSHAEYFYLSGQDCRGGVVVYDPRDGAWVDFVPTISEDERVWEGLEQRPGTPRTELPGWLDARAGRPVALLGAAIPEASGDPPATAAARIALTHARRTKDAQELALIRRAVAATAAGFRRLRENLRPGTTERALQIELEAEFYRHGGTRTGYGTIVGTGPNAAILHFEPSARAVREGDFVLVDAGAEFNRYLADVTRTYVVGKPNAFQRDLYQAVLHAQVRAIDRCVPGAEWKQIHLATAVDLMAALVDMGVMRGDPATLVETGASTLFFPHGLGHMVGLGVRDASGLLPGRQRDPRPSLRTLRMDLPLEPGYVVTVEPGLYLIPPILNDPGRRSRHRHDVNWDLVGRHLDVGGVRIEDNVLVTPGGPDVLTRAIPKTLE